MFDPIQYFLGRIVVVRVVAGLVLCLCIAWSLRPLPRLSLIQANSYPAQESSTQGASRPGDRAALYGFTVNLWSPPPPPATAKSQETTGGIANTSRPSTLKLVGITRHGERMLASLYDSKEDKLHQVRTGERVGGILILDITADGIKVESGGRRMQMLLVEGQQ